MTVDKCKSLCRDKYYTYAGLEFGNECFCGDDVPIISAPLRECHLNCKGDETQICGGFWRLSVYSITQSTEQQNGLRIWNGNTSIAHVVNSAGRWSSSYTELMMFDSNPATCWHSAQSKESELKIIGVQFKVFYTIPMRSRPKCKKNFN